MKNQYGGPCRVCGERVAVGEGLAVRENGGAWQVEHETCPAPGSVTGSRPDAPRWMVPAHGRTPGGNEAHGMTIIEGAMPEGDAWPLNDAARALAKR